MPMFMSVIACVGPKGTTTKTVNAASTTMNGAIQKTTLSASAGIMSSFRSDADVHVGNRVRGAKRDDDEDGERRQHYDERRNPEDNFVGLGGDNVFFQI